MADRLIDRTLRAFSDDLSADSPVPGGGSAAAYAGAMGAALAAMVSRIAAKKSQAPALATFAAEMDELRAEILRRSRLFPRISIGRSTAATTSSAGSPTSSSRGSRADASAARQAARREAVRGLKSAERFAP